ncbi:ATP-binding protein [Tahibacter amnicola]|uniref:ATP-binding protein n=1 Tax=Tahibacter amnicola TaxID=2976241 RepID=A0ABY6BFP1_9GAMM|nr:ATP-binding protein [Tahibacter amnicola]UXI68640.1 ATP-binding protein [Tahibacter amnicola]
MAADARAATPLPRWAETIRRKYLGGEASMFILHRNVFDEILHGGEFYTVVEFLSEVLLKDNKDTIIVYDPSAGVRYAKRSSSVAAAAEPMGANKPPEEALALIEQEILLRHSAALVITYAGSIAPPGEEHFLAHADRMAAIRLHRWSMSPELESKDNVVFLLTESLAELNGKLVANPRVAAVEIPLPDKDERAGVIRKVDPSIDAQHVARLAEHSAGLRAVQIAQLLTPRQQDTGLGDEQRLALIRSLLGSSPDAVERANKLAAITRGMDTEEIRHLINPAHPLPETDAGDPYAEVIELVHQRKREIIEKECAGLIEFVDARHGLDAVGGVAGIKSELMQVAAAIRAGDRHRVPMGLLFVGPMGTGKTFIAKAFVKESGLTAVTLKNFRSKWVGSTEANLEKVLGMVKALGPIILIIDEGDRSFGGQSEDSDGGTSSRVIARLKEFMSEPDNRGQVLFILMTNRPDKLDIDIKRAGRIDRKIPFFYPDTPEDVESVLKALFGRYKLGSAIDWVAERERTSARLVGYSNADLEALCLLALNLGGEDSTVTVEHFLKAIDDYVPARDAGMLEYMEMLAVFEASRRSMLPARYRDMSQDEFNQRLRHLKNELRL